ncbi:hypothetical protein IQ06DRAFT_245570 [Phaeosphaeriaceae sp. SRC1lsM3a]|nr:hypothetical protein IQ06DRAFT_245570 [Stagonospora sp. SRC1lsM3a]
MSFFAPHFQIVSDLHLETPLATPQYDDFHLSVQADNLFFLGDIGLVVHTKLFQFLRRILDQNRGCRIFYVLGNHEPYQTTYEHASILLRNFEQESKDNFGGRFKFLCRDRFDLNQDVTILGCTLWSAVQDDQRSDIASRSTDLNSERGIQDWTLQRHGEEHQKDLLWLNSQISRIEENEPHRQIVVATHHSPTTDTRANDPQHEGSPVSSNFVTDLSLEHCWISPKVRLWAFGHTHYNCEYREESTGKIVIANQRGYTGLGARRKSASARVKIVEAGIKDWVVLKKSNNSEESIPATSLQNKEVEDDCEKESCANQPRVSLVHRIARRVQGRRKFPSGQSQHC